VRTRRTEGFITQEETSKKLRTPYSTYNMRRPLRASRKGEEYGGRLCKSSSEKSGEAFDAAGPP